jgi:hypothetical protein
MGLDKGTSSYTILTNYNSWQLWYDLIQNLAAIYFIWKYYNLNSIKEYNDQYLNNIHIGLCKVLKRINVTITPIYHVYYLRCYTVYKQLIKLHIIVKPTT